MKNGMIGVAILFPLLASCGGAEGGEGAAGSATQAMKAGEWEITNKLTSVDVISAPPGASKEQIKAGIAKEEAHISKICLTAEQVSNPSATLFGLKEKDQCDAGNVSVKDGKIDSSFKCAPGGLSVATNIKGTYEADSFQGEAVTEFKDAGGLAFTTKSTLTGKRLGECGAS